MRALQGIIGVPPRDAEGRHMSEEHKLLKRAGQASQRPAAFKVRLCGKLRRALKRLSGEQPPPNPRRQCSPAERTRKPPLRFEPGGVTQSLDPSWVLRRLASIHDEVELEGDCVALDFMARRSPSGFRDAATFVRDLGDGQVRTITERHAGWRPEEITVIAPKAAAAKRYRPWSLDWQVITDNPRRALTDAGYLQVYYGGESALRLYRATRARLPANLMLRMHSRSLIFFVSLTDSFSGVHFDDTPSVLLCLAGNREIWVAPPGLKRACALRHPRGFPRYLDLDPRSDTNRHPSWKQVLLTEGQAVFIPAGWWHVVYGSVGSIGLSMDVERERVQV